MVVGEYEVQVYDKFVMYGNTGVLKCSVPPYVQEYVSVTSWLHDSAFNIYPSLHGGKIFTKNIYCFKYRSELTENKKNNKIIFIIKNEKLRN